MKRTYTVDDKQVEIIEIQMMFGGEEIDGLLLHDCDDEFHDGDCITSEIDYLPSDDEEAKTIIDNCYWITYCHIDEETGRYISEE